MQIKRVLKKISPNLRSARLQVQYWKVSWRFWWLVFINLLFRWFEVFKFVKLLKSFEEFEVQRHPHPYHCNATLRRQRTHSKPHRKMGCKYFETLNSKSALALLSKILKPLIFFQKFSNKIKISRNVFRELKNFVWISIILLVILDIILNFLKIINSQFMW